MAEVLQQDEIDSLLKQIQGGEDPDAIGQLIKAGEDGNERALDSACKKLIHCYEVDASEYVINQARQQVHKLAHKQWLKKRKMSRKEYIQIIRDELDKRGLVWRPDFPPGYRLQMMNQ